MFSRKKNKAFYALNNYYKQQQLKLLTENEIQIWQIQQFKSNNSPNPKVGLFLTQINFQPGKPQGC